MPRAVALPAATRRRRARPIRHRRNHAVLSGQRAAVNGKVSGSIWSWPARPRALRTLFVRRDSQHCRFAFYLSYPGIEVDKHPAFFTPFISYPDDIIVVGHLNAILTVLRSNGILGKTLERTHRETIWHNCSRVTGLYDLNHPHVYSAATLNLHTRSRRTHDNLWDRQCRSKHIDSFCIFLVSF